MKAKAALHVSDAFSLPKDAITQTFVVYGGKGKGKTNFGAVLAEELYANGLKFSALDPYGVMWGLRYGQTKNEAGIEVLILGGIQGDMPILPTAGAVVADLVSDESISTVVDISRHSNGKMWTKGERIRFVADYATRLFERQGEHRRPLMQIIDEAGRYCPQMIPHGSPELARCVGAIEEMVEVGRNVGIGVTLITQRSARMNKSVSELAECMVAFCTMGPNSVEAIIDWCGEHIEKARWKELVGTLRTLPRGTAMVVSPSWLELEGQTVAIRARHTYDSSATPKAGKRSAAPGKAAIPDLAKYRERMVEVEEQVKASDPRELRAKLEARDRRIAELERKAQEAPRAVPAKAEPPPLDDAGFAVMMKDVYARLEKMAEAQQASGFKLADVIQAFWKKQSARSGVATKAPVVAERASVQPSKRPDVQTLKASPAVSRPTVDSGIPPARQRILNALAFLESIGVRQADRIQLAMLADQSPGSGGYANNLGALRTHGLLDYPSSGQVQLTDAGRALAEAQAPQSTGELHQLIRSKLAPARWRIVETLIEAYPFDIDRAELAEASGQAPTSGGYANNLGALRSLGLIDYPSKGRVVAMPVLFLEGR